MKIPEAFTGSQAMQLVVSQGWKYREVSSPKIEIERCPYCKKDGFHLGMEIHGAGSGQTNRDGLHGCVHCGKGGNLYTLKQHLGIVQANIESRRDSGSSGENKKQEELPDTEACHEALLADEAALDYLVNGRGFSMDVIGKMKLGLVEKRFFRGVGEVRALVYPYMVNGNTVFCHYRTLPTMPLSENLVPKAFSSPTGWPVPLYNGEILNDQNLTEATFVEGEPDVICAIDHGVKNICGVPGANFKKAEWIDSLDRLDKVYVCYDKDAVGQKAAQELANRIGIEKCWKIILPDFQVTTEKGEQRNGKDLNEWFTQGGGTPEAFEKLKEEAQLFDVAGVASSKDSMQEFYDELEGKTTLEPKYKTQWPSLNKLVGFEDGDVIDILAPEKIGKTTFALNLMDHMVSAYGEDGVFICLEMTRARMARKWVSYLGQVADNIPKSVEEGEALKAAFMEARSTVQAITAAREGDLYFCYPKYKSVEDIYGLIRDVIRRYGAKWICIDNIHRLADSTPYDNRTQHLSQISKITSQIAKDYGVKLVRILQPNRIKAGAIVSSDNTDGSSQIAKDCDCTITLHRTKLGELSADDFEKIGYVEQEAAFGEDVLTGVPLSRYSSGGYCTLHVNGETSTFMEKNEGQIAKMKADSNKNVGHENQLANLGIVLKKDYTGEVPMGDVVF